MLSRDKSLRARTYHTLFMVCTDDQGQRRAGRDLSRYRGASSWYSGSNRVKKKKNLHGTHLGQKFLVVPPPDCCALQIRPSPDEALREGESASTERSQSQQLDLLYGLHPCGFYVEGLEA